MQSRRPLFRIFLVPVLLAVLSLSGLTLALGGDGLPDAIAWSCVAAPVLVALWALAARRA